MIETAPTHDHDRTAKVLHTIVGHKLPICFVNAVRSVRTLAPGDDLLVIDNASNLPGLTQQLLALESAGESMMVITRASHDLSHNTTVGGLYDAYREAVDYALDGGYDLLHLIQGDMQMPWWGPSMVDRALDLYDSFPDCVNIVTTAIPRDRGVAGAVSEVQESTMELVGYDLTDTGLYHLGRWRERGVRFHGSEQGHARFYRQAGLRVICHPWPPIAQIPWPAVVRNGEVRGREVVPEQPLLLLPLSDQEIADVKGERGPTWLEDVCTPWGWTCLTPMLATALESIDHWVSCYRDLRSRGWRRARPNWERRGLEPKRSIWRTQRRPSVWQVALLPPWHELRRRLR